MSELVLASIITGCATVIAALLSVLIAKVGGIHKLVNSAAAAQQKKIDDAAKEVAELKAIIMRLELHLPVRR